MYSCTTCSKDLKSKQSLIYHMENRKTPCKPPTVVCPNCNKGLSSKSSLWRHRKICSGSGLSRVVSQSDSESGDSQSNNVELDDEVQAVSVPNTFVWKANENTQKNHSFLLPRDIRGIIVGKSGFGKTTLLNYMLLEPDILDYNNLIVCGNSLHQPEYKIMNTAFAKKLSKKQIKALFEHQDEAMEEGGPERVIENIRDDMCKGDINAEFYTDVTRIPDPAAHDPTQKNLLILDDIMLGPQNTAEAYYTRGRHNNVDVFYISQNYFRLPRQTVRENETF